MLLFACTHLKQRVAWNHPPAPSIANEAEEDYLPPLHTQMPPSVFLTTQGMAAIYEMDGYCHPISQAHLNEDLNSISKFQSQQF